MHSHDDHCHHKDHHGDHNHFTSNNPNDPRWRKVLWFAFVANAAMFLAEIISGAMAGSSALQADALDFFSDAANAALSLSVAGLALTWRSRTAYLKGATMGAIGLWILWITLNHLIAGTVPEAHVMGIVGTLALITNGSVALLLWRYRSGDANMRSFWLCTRNDVLGNIAVLCAAAGYLAQILGTQTSS